MANKVVSVRFQIKADTDREAFIKKLEKFAQIHEAHIALRRQGPKKGKSGTSKELEILLSLSRIETPTVPGYAPVEMTQAGIATSVDLDVSVVSRYLSKLKYDKLLRVKTLNIIGEGRKKKAYFLSESGQELVEKIKSQYKKKK